MGFDDSLSTPQWLVPESVEAVGFTLCEAAHKLTSRPAAVVEEHTWSPPLASPPNPPDLADRAAMSEQLGWEIGYSDFIKNGKWDVDDVLRPIYEERPVCRWLCKRVSALGPVAASACVGCKLRTTSGRRQNASGRAPLVVGVTAGL